MRRFAAVGVMLFLSACQTPIHYVNKMNPSAGQTDFDRDNYQCMQENQHPSAVVAGSYGSAGTTVNQGMVAACLSAKGWQETPRAWWQSGGGPTGLNLW